ncbi:MAG: SCO family protein [Candidatus Accumulibacter sp.]|uniref:SCO family protein n=1 Tax=Accumulibacter sp. TaxID=2053492 RepID=UPI001A3A3342|nr:SCO family protein [Accumulibacter sp.]MBL8392557.1 SCO family protein [Accumulibacter sp.]HRD89081.1 SCO family protein [Accumulibacter sp.]
MSRRFGVALCVAFFLVPIGQRAAADDGAADLPAGLPARYLLMDANGRAVSNDDFPGRLQLISFGYTFCPDVCPTTLAEMAAVLGALGPDAERLQAIFISVDPERDTASMLRSYVSFFDPRIIGLSGSPALVRRAADHFGVRYEQVREPGAPADQYAVDHSVGMFLLSTDGRYLRRFAYATPATEIAARIREIISASPQQPGQQRQPSSTGR